MGGATCTRTPHMDEVEYGVGQWIAFDPLTTRRQDGETHALYTRLEHTASHEELRPGACVFVRCVAARAVVNLHYTALGTLRCALCNPHGATKYN
jgi:hypothetical protein